MSVSSSGVVAVVGLIAVSLCGGALAQNPQAPAPGPPAAQAPAEPPQNPQQDDPVAAAIGAWELSNADHDKICHLDLRADAAPGGRKVDIDKNCPNVFPSTKDIVAWDVDNYGSLKLIDGHGETVIDFTLVEGGMYDGFKPEEGRYILQAAAAVNTTLKPDDVAGDWGIARGAGKPICLLTLSGTAVAAGSDYLMLKIKPGCDAAVTRFGPASWRLDSGDLVLSSPRGQSWRFEQNDSNTWQRVPETTDPMLLVRQ